MAVVLELDVRMGGAEKQIKDLQNQLDLLKNKAAQAGGKDGLESIVKNGGAMGILNDLTGGLAMKFKDAYESIQLSNNGLKGMKAAIAATGIGLLVVAVGAIAANWEDIVAYIEESNTDLAIQQNLANGIRALTKKTYDDYVAIENTLRLQGLSEDEILAKRTELLGLDIKSVEFQLTINRILLARLEIQDQEAKKNVEQLGFFGKLLGLKAEESEQTKETKNAISEQDSELKRLQATYDGLLITKTDREKAAEEKRQAILADGIKRDEEILKQREKDQIDSMQRITQAQQDENAKRLENQKQADHDAAVARLETTGTTNAQIKADTDKINADNLRDEQNLANAKKSIQSSTFAFLNTIAEIYGQGNEKRARTAFRISKALGLAEASVNTYQAISAVLTDKTLPGPTKFIAAASAGLIGLAQVAKIASTQFNSGGGGGGGGGSIPSMGGDSGGSPQAQSPQAAIDFSFLQNQQPIQTYVIGSEVKTSNEAEQKIKDQSTL